MVGPVNGAWNVVMGTVGTERITTMLRYLASFDRELSSVVDAAGTTGATADPVVRQRLALPREPHLSGSPGDQAGGRASPATTVHSRIRHDVTRPALT